MNGIGLCMGIALGCDLCVGVRAVTDQAFLDHVHRVRQGS